MTYSEAPDLDQLLRSADPLPPTAALLPVDDLPNLLRLHAHRRARSRRLRVGSGAAVALGLLAATPAAANFVSAHTGRQTPACAPGVHCEDGTGEQIRLDGQDIRAVYSGYLSGYALPAGQTWTHFLDRVSTPVDGLMAASGLDATVAYSAQCQWEHAWLTARAGNDGERLAAARHELVDVIPGWTALTSTEVQTPNQEQLVAEAVRNDSPAFVTQVTAANCVPGDWGSSAPAESVVQ